MLPLNPKEKIIEARNFESEGFILEAYRSYGEGIEILKSVLRNTEHKNDERRAMYERNIIQLENNCKALEDRIFPKNQLVKNDRFRIERGETDKSYARILGKYLNETVKEVHIYEPYLMEEQQIENLVCFLELLVKSCKNLRYVCVFTKKVPKTENFKVRQDALRNLIKQFREYNIFFRYRFKNTSHDRLIMLGNGTNISLGYGLDFYMRQPKFSLGTFDYTLRKCKETFINITYEQNKNLQENEGEESYETQYEEEDANKNYLEREDLQ